MLRSKEELELNNRHDLDAGRLRCARHFDGFERSLGKRGVQVAFGMGHSQKLFGILRTALVDSRTDANEHLWEQNIQQVVVVLEA